MEKLEALKQRLRQFTAERDWQRYHTPKNVSTALIVEAAELVENFQWLTPEESMHLTPEQHWAVEEEVADVFIYLVRLSDILEIDLFDAADRKIDRNAEKYPVEKVRGNFIKR